VRDLPEALLLDVGQFGRGHGMVLLRFSASGVEDAFDAAGRRSGLVLRKPNNDA
jgi:hypothetical protein